MRAIRVNRSRRLMMCFAVAAGVMLWTSCGGAHSPLPAPITFGNGVGGVYVVMTPAQVDAAWKLRLHLVASEDGSSPVADAVVCVGKMRATLHFFGALEHLVSIWFTGEATTEKGVGIGSSVAELRRAYKTRLEQPSDSSEKGFRFYRVVEQGPPPRVAIGFAVRDGWTTAVEYGIRNDFYLSRLLSGKHPRCPHSGP